MAQLLIPIDCKNVTEHYTSSVVHYYYKSLYSLCWLKHYLLLAELNPEQVRCLDPSSVRNIMFQDFQDSLKRIRRSVSPHSLAMYEKWNLEFGDVSL